MASVQIPHFKWPFQVGADQAVVCEEQDTPDDIQQSVEILMLTEHGSRVELPDYGIPQVLFAETIDRPTIMAAVLRWEPRANVLITDYPDNLDELIRHIQVSVLEDVLLTGVNNA